MYAIVRSGSKQLRVQKGDIVRVDSINAEPGQETDLQEVLFISRDDGTAQVGAPTVPGCSIRVQCLGDAKGPKITALKYKKRKNQYRKFGHRQRYKELKVVDIQG